LCLPITLFPYTTLFRSISNFDSNNSQESGNPISMDQDFYPEFNSVKGVERIQAVATKFGIIRTETDFEAIILKGVGADFNWKYFQDFLVEGRLPDYSKERNEDVLISQYLANRLRFKLGDSFTALFRKDDPNKPPSMITYNIVGIYSSGFKDLDRKSVLGDLRHLQRLN